MTGGQVGFGLVDSWKQEILETANATLLPFDQFENFDILFGLHHDKNNYPSGQVTFYTLRCFQFINALQNKNRKFKISRKGGMQMQQKEHDQPKKNLAFLK